LQHICSAAAPTPQNRLLQLEITTTDLGQGLYLLNWQGGDSRVLAGDDGVLLVDASAPEMTGKIRAAVTKISDKPTCW